MTDLYAILGIPRDADTAAIRAAYRQASKTAHPDGGGTAEAFAEVKLAHDCLIDPDRRAHYDQTGDPGHAKVDEGRAVILQMLAKAMEAACAEMTKAGFEPHHVDLVEQMGFWFDAQIKSLAKQRAVYAAAKTRDQHLLGRFKVVEGESNILEQIVRSRLDTYDMNERMLAMNELALKAGRELLGKFTFQPWAHYGQQADVNQALQGMLGSTQPFNRADEVQPWF